MGNRRQTKWSGSYSMKYSHGKTYENSQKVFMKVIIEWIKKGSRFHSTIKYFDGEKINIPISLEYWIILTYLN